ncbi:hypothetical protein ACFLQR_02290 [Verrucomicrobiota bacterium]
MRVKIACLIALSFLFPGFPLNADEAIRYGTCGSTGGGKAVIDFLKEMGANAVMVSPVDARAVNVEKNKEFLAAAHEAGLYVSTFHGSRYFIHWNKEKTGLKYPYCYRHSEYRLDYGTVIKQVASCGFDVVSVAPEEMCWMRNHITYEFGAWGKRATALLDQAGPNKYPYSDTFEKEFKRKYKVPIVQDEANPDFRFFMQARYQSVTDAIKYWNKCAKKTDPSCETTVLLSNVLATDRRYNHGAAWDMVGFQTGVDRIGTDPYIILHNYRGDGDHWYVTETATHLVGAGKKRQADAVLEISRLRNYQRPLRPVEMYGAALSSVFHGARSIYYFQHMMLMEIKPYEKVTSNPARSRADLKKTFSMLKDITPWVEGSYIPRKIAVLYSRSGEDMYQLLLKQGKSDLLHQSRSYGYRYSFLANKGVLGALFKNGYPFEMYFIEQLSYDQIRDFELLILPFPLAVSRDKAKILRKAVKNGANLLVISEYGSLDELGNLNKTASLLDLLGLKSVSRKEGFQALTFSKESPILAGENFAGVPFSVYTDIELLPGAQWLAQTPEGKGIGVVLNEAKKQGKTMFLAGEFGIKAPIVPVLFSYAGDFDRITDCSVTDSPWERIAIFEKNGASVETKLSLCPSVKQYKMYFVYKGGKEAKKTDKLRITLNDKLIKEIPLNPEWENTDNREFFFTPDPGKIQNLKITLKGAPGAGVHKMYFTPVISAKEKGADIPLSEKRYSAVLLSAIDYLLGEDKPLILRKKGMQDIEATMLEKKNGEKLLLVINWEDSAVKAGLGIPLPAGEYKIEERNQDRMKEFSIKGKKVFSSADLRNLELELKGQEARILRIFR